MHRMESRGYPYEISHLRISVVPCALNLVVRVAIILWNTVYLDRAVAALGEHGVAVDRKLSLLRHNSELENSKARNQNVPTRSRPSIAFKPPFTLCGNGRPARRELVLIGRLISWVRRFRRNRFLFNGFVAPLAVASGPVPFGCGLRFRLALDLGGDLFAHLGPILGFLDIANLQSLLYLLTAVKFREVSRSRTEYVARSTTTGVVGGPGVVGAALTALACGPELDSVVQDDGA